MKASYRILVHGLSPAQVKEIQSAVPQAQIVTGKPEQLNDNVLEADGMVGVCTPELIRLGKKLRWVQVFDAGVESYNFPELVMSRIVLTNTKILQGPEVADHALALLLCLTRNLHQIIRSKDIWSLQRNYSFAESQGRPIELRRKRALILGLGGIGSQIAERAAAFGMTVSGVDAKDVPFSNVLAHVYKPDQLKQALPDADIIVISAPLTAETEGMLGSGEFSAMKGGAYLINVSRGKLVDTNALVQALRDGKLKGVGLDVTDPEPLPHDHPLWGFDNVVITPHLAAISDHNRERRFELIKDNVMRFVKGLPLRNIVDKDKGY